VKKLLFACAMGIAGLAIAATLMSIPADASWQLIPGDTTDRHFHGCGSSWTICSIRAQNRAARSRADANTPHRYCDALCQAKCDATSSNPQACYAKWQKINAAGRGRECETANASGRRIPGC